MRYCVHIVKMRLLVKRWTNRHEAAGSLEKLRSHDRLKEVHTNYIWAYWLFVCLVDGVC
jgi:hypothetical protein